MASKHLLAHGTRATALPDIAKVGLRPRGGKGTNNWQHTVGSNPKAVYLTSAYALYFAQSAAEIDGDLALIEVNARLVEGRLVADEDAVEQVMRERSDQEPDHVRNGDLKRRTLYYRSRAHQYAYMESLKALGTCAHMGTIPVAALGRVVIVPEAVNMRLIMEVGIDPMIHVRGFAVLGAHYEVTQRWLFGDESTLVAFGGARSFSPAETFGVEHYADLRAALARGRS